MAASEGMTEPDVMNSENYELDQERASPTQPGEDASVNDLAIKSKVSCQHCGKLYLTKKSLKRHLDSNVTACAKERLSQEEALQRPSKPRWACSRCGKDCASSNSVERHISNSCWKTCEECVFNGVPRCDSFSKVGPCRTCEAKGLPCTKHTCPISGTKPRPFTGPAKPAREKTLSDDEDVSAANQKLRKRRISTTPAESPADAHKTKRNMPAGQQVDAYGLGRMIDPLGGQVYVPSQIKKAAVSDWLQEQPSTSASMVRTQDEQVQSCSSRVAQAGLPQTVHPGQHLHGFFESARDSILAQPTATSFLPSRRGGGTSAQYYRSQTPPAQPLNKSLDCGPIRLPDFPRLPSYSGRLSTHNVFVQMQASRQQQLSLQQQQARQQQWSLQQQQRRQQRPSFQSDTHDQRLLPRPNFSAVPRIGRLDVNPAQADLNLSPLPPLPQVKFNSLGDDMLVLRVHSNTYDKRGQPIFSILHIRRKEIFGPHLNAYCINRGKEYGLNWMFVYRYYAGTSDNPRQHMQITLTWDMTPADVKDDEFPGVAMRNMDTIYVMQAKPLTHSDRNRTQSPGPQIAGTEVNILSGETPFYQNSDVSRQWYQAVEQDAVHLRDACSAMKTMIKHQQERIAEQDEEIERQGQMLGELTELSGQLRHRMQLSASDPLVQRLEKGWEDAREHVVERTTPDLPAQRLHPLQPGKQQGKQEILRSTQSRTKTPTPFVAKCEAVRDPQAAPPRRSTARFPGSGFAGELNAPGYIHQPNLNIALGPQTREHSRFVDAADKVGADSPQYEGEHERQGEDEDSEMEAR